MKRQPLYQRIREMSVPEVAEQIIAILMERGIETVGEARYCILYLHNYFPPAEHKAIKEALRTFRPRKVNRLIDSRRLLRPIMIDP